MSKTIKSFFAIALIALSFVGCEKYQYIDYRAMAENEQQILDEFYDSPIFDSLIQLGDTTDARGSKNNGWFLITKDVGTGDKITTGKIVGLRYTLYVLGRDNGKVTFTDTIDNYSKLDPDLFIAGSSEIMGLNYAIANMRKYGKGIVVLPSTWWEKQNSYQPSNYYSIVYDFEVTYLEK
jgi:hypothetical protein